VSTGLMPCCCVFGIIIARSTRWATSRSQFAAVQLPIHYRTAVQYVLEDLAPSKAFCLANRISQQASRRLNEADLDSSSFRIPDVRTNEITVTPDPAVHCAMRHHYHITHRQDRQSLRRLPPRTCECRCLSVSVKPARQIKAAAEATGSKSQSMCGGGIEDAARKTKTGSSRIFGNERKRSEDMHYYFQRPLGHLFSTVHQI